MPARLWFALAFAAVGLFACSNSICDTNADCVDRGADFVCANQTCVRDTPQDSGAGDSGVADSGVPDSGAADSGSSDSGIPDAGRGDSGTPDSGSFDSGVPDAGLADSGVPDSGTADSGVPDAGLPDGGTVTVGEWNLEFFGKPDAGPSDDALQAQNVATVMGQTNADIWALEEVCDESRLTDVVNTLASSYGEHYDVVLPDTTSVTNPYSGYGGTWGQKTALMFRSGLFTKVSADLVYNPKDTLTGSSIDSSWSSNFSSRDPLEVHLQFTTGAGTQDLWVVVVHLKAGTSSFSQRQQESADLKTYLDEYHPSDALMMVGDYNDDLNKSIDGTDPSPFENFLNATASYEFPSKVFSDTGEATTVNYTSAIDHHLITNELFGNLVAGSPTVLHPSISNYAATTSDHYPTVVKYQW